MRIARFDLDTYNQTKELSGMPSYGVSIEDNYDYEIEPITDQDGNPTRGSIIGYYLSLVIVAGLLAYMFLVL